MNKFLFGMVIVSVSAVNQLNAQAPPLVRINRFFGLGWSDGYHVASNPCAACNGVGGNCAVCQSSMQQEMKAPAPAPKVQPAVESGAPATGQIRFNTDRSKIISFVRLDRTSAPPLVPSVSSPRLVRLPPVVQQTSVTRRLPPVTDVGPR